MNQSNGRRHFLQDTFTGLSGIALASLLDADGLIANEFSSGKPVIDPTRPFAARPSHHQASAENVLVIFSKLYSSDKKVNIEDSRKILDELICMVNNN